MSVLLEVSGLTVRYDADEPLTAVADVSFTVRRGEILGLAGESGSGKSTLVTALLRLQRPPAVTTAGRALLHRPGAEPVDLLRADRRELRALRWERVAIVFQSAMNALNPVQRLEKQFVDGLRAHRRMSRAAARDRAGELLGLVGIPADRLAAFPHELSGGMRQRATIALALSCEPDLVVMDEPTTAVDVVTQRQILRQIVRLQRRLDFAVVFITHDLSLLLEIADRIAVMYGGRIVELGTAEQVHRAARHPYTRGLRDSFPPLHGPVRPMRGIPGSPVDLRRPPPGCSFAPRCPLATVECGEIVPPLEGAEHVVACIHADRTEPADA